MSESEKMELTQPETEAVQPAKEKKDKVAAKKKKDGVFTRLARTFREMKSELKKVSWPTRKQVVKNTLVVIVCCIIVGICIWAFDWIANLLIDALLSLF